MSSCGRYKKKILAEKAKRARENRFNNSNNNNNHNNTDISLALKEILEYPDRVYNKQMDI